MTVPAAMFTSIMSEACLRRSTVYVSRSASPASPARTALSFQARLVASRIPEFQPWPSQTGIRWAASPARKTPPLRNSAATRPWWVKVRWLMRRSAAGSGTWRASSARMKAGSSQSAVGSSSWSMNSHRRMPCGSPMETYGRRGSAPR